MCTFITILLFLLFNPFSIMFFMCLIFDKHNNKFHNGWTKVMQDGNGKFVIMEWTLAGFDWESEWYQWFKTDYKFDNIDDALNKSNEINEKIMYKVKSNELKDIP